MTSELFSARKGHIPRIDLMAARHEEQASARRTCCRSLAGLGALCALAGGAFLPLSLRALTLQAQVQKAQRATQLARHQEEQDTQTSGNGDARPGQWARFTQSRQQRRVWRDTMHALITPLPAQIAVETLLLESKSNTITITLSGSSENIGAVRDYVGTLEHGAGLRQAHLTGASADFTFGPEAAKFTISAQAGKSE